MLHVKQSIADVAPPVPPTPAQRSYAQQQQAPVFIKTDRGPNLNRRETRKQAAEGGESFDFDWEIPDYDEYDYHRLPRRAPPSPPSGPPSWGPTPIPETPPPRTIFEPTVYESKVEADDYDRKV